jgi:hypothetical protein
VGSGGTPCSGVDITFIALAKRSAAYRAIRQRIASPCPSDSWYDNGLALVIFDLHRLPDAPPTQMMPQVVFVSAAASATLLAVRIVEADNADGADIDPDVLYYEGPPPWASEDATAAIERR